MNTFFAITLLLANNVSNYGSLNMLVLSLATFSDFLSCCMRDVEDSVRRESEEVTSEHAQNYMKTLVEEEGEANKCHQLLRSHPKCQTCFLCVKSSEN